MGYLHIDNLYRSQNILLFKKCWALEKVHGTSAHLHFTFAAGDDAKITYFSGGASHSLFKSLFDDEALLAMFTALGHREVTVYGEAYGGSQQGMKAVYGDFLRFIVFDVKVGETWLSVPDMVQVAGAGLLLEVVPHELISTDLADLDFARDEPSVVAERRGCGRNKPREGVVLRPPIEMTTNDGKRIIAKHKLETFSERATPQKIIDPTQLEVLTEANAIAQEWVTPMRLAHVLDKLEPRALAGGLDIKDTGRVIKAMVEDITREAAGEIVPSKEATAAIGKRAAALYKEIVTKIVTG